VLRTGDKKGILPWKQIVEDESAIGVGCRLAAPSRDLGSTDGLAALLI
jgi:hypothetical protein